MKINYEPEYDRWEFTPEDDLEDAELSYLRDECAMAHPVTLKKMLYVTDSLWKGLILADQILSDLQDYATLEMRKEKKENGV